MIATTSMSVQPKTAAKCFARCFASLAVFNAAACVSAASAGAPEEATQFQAFSIDFETDATHELAAENPFLDYRLNVTFTCGEARFVVPGHYAADGDAGETGADSGGVWRVWFNPPTAGTWTYDVSFRRGSAIALAIDPYVGEPVTPHDGASGTFRVKPADPSSAGFHRTGGIVTNGSRYLHTRDGAPLLLYGTNSPENLLAYADFDGTRSAEPERASYLKTWQPHVRDWRDGDPQWRGGRGRGLIGALNYLASKRMNVLYALTLNLEGDASDVWPFVEPKRSHFLRYDVSKLAQWDIVFGHAARLGIAIEVILQEQENQLLLDNGDLGPERRLYLRELVSRFAHHGNPIWNIGEENGGQVAYWPQGQNDQQRFAMIRHLKELDPYGHPVLLHTYATAEERDPIVERLLRMRQFDGVSLQSANTPKIHGEVAYWRDRSAEYDNQWVVMSDEIGPWHTGAAPDAEADEASRATLREEVLWGALMAGATGVEWYFGWLADHNDLNAEDWRSRDRLWDMTAVARDFFSGFKPADSRPADGLASPERAHCLAKPGDAYAVYAPRGAASQLRLDLSDDPTAYDVRWYDPRRGGEFRVGSVVSVKGGSEVALGTPPDAPEADWAVLLTSQPGE